MSEKHLNTRFSYSLEQLRSLWDDLNDNQRIEMIKSIIYTAPDFHDKVLIILGSYKFKKTLD